MWQPVEPSASVWPAAHEAGSGWLLAGCAIVVMVHCAVADRGSSAPSTAATAAARARRGIAASPPPRYPPLLFSTGPVALSR